MKLSSKNYRRTLCCIHPPTTVLLLLLQRIWLLGRLPLRQKGNILNSKVIKLLASLWKILTLLSSFTLEGLFRSGKSIFWLKLLSVVRSHWINRSRIGCECRLRRSMCWGRIVWSRSVWWGRRGGQKYICRRRNSSLKICWFHRYLSNK